jgi:dihydrofolate reductase
LSENEDRKIILFIATSLDGFIAREDGNIDWLFTDQDYGYKEFYDSIDTVLTGRKTYETALLFEAEPYADKECYVFSRLKTSLPGDVIIVKNDAVELVERLRARPGRHIWLLGGAELVDEFMKHNLIDEFRIFVHPHLLGSGIPLFKSSSREIKLKLLRSQNFSSGLVEMHLRREE